MDLVCERTRISLSCIACIYSISKPQWHFKGITGRQPKPRASLFLVAVLAYLLSSFYSCPRADGSVTSDSSQSFTQVLERDIGCIRTAASILGRSFAEEDGYPFHSTRICSVNHFRLEASPAIFSHFLSFDVRLLNECDRFTRNLSRLSFFLYEIVNLMEHYERCCGCKFCQSQIEANVLFITLLLTFCIAMMTFVKIFSFFICFLNAFLEVICC